MLRSYIVFEGPRQSGKTHRLLGCILDRINRGWNCIVMAPYNSSLQLMRERIKAGSTLVIATDHSVCTTFGNGAYIRWVNMHNHGHDTHGMDTREHSLFLNDPEWAQEVFGEIIDHPFYDWKEIVMTRCTGPDAPVQEGRLN